MTVKKADKHYRKEPSDLLTSGGDSVILYTRIDKKVGQAPPYEGYRRLSFPRKRESTIAFLRMDTRLRGYDSMSW